MDKDSINDLLFTDEASNQLLAINVAKSALRINKIDTFLDLILDSKNIQDISRHGKEFSFLNIDYSICISQIEPNWIEFILFEGGDDAIRENILNNDYSRLRKRLTYYLREKTKNFYK